jgi:1-acyl-sn-glycerol-3-phosphate acyltransferase
MRIFWTLYLYLNGWAVNGTFPYHLKKSVVIVGPHTSNWDFFIGLALRSKLRIQYAKFLGKQELFKGPFGFFFKKLGGFPVNRSGQNNMVDDVVNLFHTHHSFVLVLSPEGTRKKVDRLRTGFYHIAKKARVPIIMTAFDFANKRLHIAEPFYPTNNEEADMQYIISFYTPIKGKIPENGLGHLLPTNSKN